MTRPPYRNTYKTRRGSRGFTLLEIMVALTVFATISAAVITASQYMLKHNVRLDEKRCAVWLADNHLSELQVGAVPATAKARVKRHFDQREWWLSQSIVPATPPGLLNVEISVSHADSDRVVHRASAWIDSRNE